MQKFSNFFGTLEFFEIIRLKEHIPKRHNPGSGLSALSVCRIKDDFQVLEKMTPKPQNDVYHRRLLLATPLGDSSRRLLSATPLVDSPR